MNSGKVKCTCGWSWNKSDSSKKDMYICHECGRDNSNNMKNGGWLDGHSDTPKAQTGNKTLSSEYIDISKKYGIPQFTEEYINKAVELNKKYPGSKFVCDANGCADIASQAASGMGYDFGKANAWDYGNRSDILFTNPNYTEELKDPNGPLHNPTSYKVPKEFLGMQNVLIGLNRKNNLLNAEGKKVGDVPNAQQLAAAANKGEANDSYDYANQDLYEGSRGYEHIGYMLGNNNLLHGTAANKDHPAFFVIDDISDGVNLAGYGKYEPVEAIAEPTMVQTLTNKLKSLGTKAEKALFGESDKTTPPTFKKKKNGGWLDSYAEGGRMQEYQENYNDSQAFAPEGMVGDGFSNVGRNYSPAWGGQFKEGGKVDPPGKKKPIYVSSKNDPRYKAYQDSLSLYNYNKLQRKLETPGEENDSFLNTFGLDSAVEETKRKQKILETAAKKAVKESDGRIKFGTNYDKNKPKFTKDRHGNISKNETSLEGYEKRGSWDIYNPNILPKGTWKGLAINEDYSNVKPQQQVIVKDSDPPIDEIVDVPVKRTKIKAIQNNLRPEGLVYGNTDLYSELPTIRPVARNAKSYKVRETVQGKYAPSTVDYEVTDPRNINMNDLGPGNTRVVTPEYAMGGSIPGAVGFTYARTKGIPSNGPYAKKTLASAQNGVDMYENPMLARRVDNPNVNRSYYDPRLNIMNIGTDYNTWKDDNSNQLTGDDLKYHQDKMLAHENYHAIQHSQGRDNYDIAHNTDDAQWAQMQKRPQMMSTDAVWNNFYNRSDFEDEQDYQEMINSYPESRILNPNLLFDKVLDSQRYDNPANLEGEAKFYEDTGVDISKQQSEISLNPIRFQNGGEMRYYQNGLDWKPKGMENGGWLSKYDEAEKGITVPPTNPRAFLRSLKNDAMNKKIAASKGRGRETNVTQKDNTRTVTPKVDKPITTKQKEKRAVEQNKEALIKSNIQANMEDAYESPLMSPGYFTPEGVAIGALQGVTKLGPDLYEGNYKGAALDVLMALPIAPELGQLSKQGLKQGVDLFHPVGRALAQIEREGAAAGLSAQEIKKLQLEKVGITSMQREGYFPGVSEVVSEYITPYSYDNPVKRVLDIPRRIIKGEKNSKNLADIGPDLFFNEGKLSKPRYDAWKMYSGLPQENNTFRIAETTPINHPNYSAEQLANLEKFSLNEEKRLLNSLPQDHDFTHLAHGEKQDLVEALPNLKTRLQEIQDLKAQGIDIGNDYMQTNVMGGYNRRYFNDQMEYNDIWDLDLGGTKVDKYFGKPFLSHGQLDYSFKPAEDQIRSLIQRGEYYDRNLLKIKQPEIEYADFTNSLNPLNPKDLTIKKKKQGGIIKAQEGTKTKPTLGGGKYYTTDNKVVDWGTPEYEAAYNRGEVLSDDGVRSEVTVDMGVLPELVLQNNYKRGFWEQYRDKIIDENRDAGPLGAAVGVPLSAVTSLPQLAMMKGINNLPTLFGQQPWNDGQMQRPSEAIGFDNDEGAFANPISFGKHASNFLLDAVTDPANLIGAGVLTKENALSKLGKISTSIAPELRQGVNTNGFLDMFKSKPKFNSEINWGAWNKEIPENSQLMKEYNAIEQTSKANNTWMKNPDGSKFQGTPEQFVQQNSENFKKYVENAKGNYNELLEKPFSYHGSRNNNITEFHTPQHSDYIKATGDTPETGIFLTNEKSLADIYATKNKTGKLYELYAPANYARPSLRNPNNIIETSVGTNIEKPILTGNLDLKDVEYLKSLNYTGIADHYLPNSSLEKVVFDSNIIKSATGNNGMFDMTNPNIYKSILPFVGYTGAGALTYKTLQGQEETPEYKQGGVIKDDRGQWAHPGEITEIGSNNITMQGVPYDVLGISDKGDIKLMKPGKNYKFKGKKVTEFPMAKNGVNQQDEKTLQRLDQLTNFTNYNKPQPGGWLNKYN